MSLELFAHNQQAYEAVTQMLALTGKAAVVHPTGTGKSFIGFRLCADYPNARICWLSPSEYIVRTQLENLRAAAHGWAPENIRFYTYAKLSQMGADALAEIRPDLIILDEFHRCGAQQWGAGVRALLRLNRDARVLGLSATAIRYLDNQRNMVKELFDDHIASELSLGEAIVRGILPAPKYVLTVYDYEKRYNDYRARILRSKSAAVRDKAERELESLRRALDQADGLDEIFAKHMDPNGKYLVFCSSLHHLQQMRRRVSQWFAKVDPKPQVYTAYSADAGAKAAFSAFKQDASKHLKLLFTIDMLNEGIHVDHLSGVVLFRPTVSPIVFKQQIGRALSASGQRAPVIFDVVNNIDTICAISAVEQEMQLAVSDYRSLGIPGYVVQERFRVVDELGDVRALFERLNETLTASWDTMYACASSYFAAHGDLNVPKRWQTPEGYSLGSWVYTQRRVYAGELYGTLSPERIAKLEQIGMIWDSAKDLAWRRYYAAAAAYWERNGNLVIPAKYKTPEGLRLGAWLANLRTYRKSGLRSSYLSKQRIEALDRIGMVWEVADYLWEQYFDACMQYVRENGNLQVPTDYVSKAGFRLGSWLRRQKLLRQGKLPGTPPSPEQISRLDALGMQWDGRYEQAFRNGVQHLKDFCAERGCADVPVSYAAPDGYRLGRWLDRQRQAQIRGKLSPERKKDLERLGVTWKEKPGVSCEPRVHG